MRCPTCASSSLRASARRSSNATSPDEAGTWERGVDVIGPTSIQMTTDEPGEEGHGGEVPTFALLAALAVGLVVVATLLGGKPAAIGGGVAVIAQLWAVALLRPKMRAPNPEFMARWLGGMGIRLLGVGIVLIVSRTVPALLGYVGVLLPLLFLETRFLR